MRSKASFQAELGLNQAVRGEEARSQPSREGLSLQREGRQSRTQVQDKDGPEPVGTWSRAKGERPVQE